MEQSTVNLRKEQESTMARRPYKYSLMSRFFFISMDILTGRQMTLSKARLLEILATIPYRTWEIRQYIRMTRYYKHPAQVQDGQKIMEWSRTAQDTEFLHLVIVNEKMKEDGAKDAWYLIPAIPYLMLLTYAIMMRLMALFSIRSTFLFNAQFEDHAEHEYARLVANHPEWEDQPVKSDLVREYCDAEHWADVFRRIGLDERDHMNESFAFASKPEHVVKYDGMPSA